MGESLIQQYGVSDEGKERYVEGCLLGLAGRGPGWEYGPPAWPGGVAYAALGGGDACIGF